MTTIQAGMFAFTYIVSIIAFALALANRRWLIQAEKRLFGVVSENRAILEELGRLERDARLHTESFRQVVSEIGKRMHAIERLDIVRRIEALEKDVDSLNSHTDVNHIPDPKW